MHAQSSRASRHWMRYLELSAPPELADLVHRSWFLETDRAADEAKPILPDGRPELIFHLGEPFSLEADDGRRELQDALRRTVGTRARVEAIGRVLGVLGRRTSLLVTQAARSERTLERRFNAGVGDDSTRGSG